LSPAPPEAASAGHCRCSGRAGWPLPTVPSSQVRANPAPGRAWGQKLASRRAAVPVCPQALRASGSASPGRPAWPRRLRLAPPPPGAPGRPGAGSGQPAPPPAAALGPSPGESPAAPGPGVGLPNSCAPGPPLNFFPVTGRKTGFSSTKTKSAGWQSRFFREPGQHLCRSAKTH
jgi:hypothetical protein